MYIYKSFISFYVYNKHVSLLLITNDYVKLCIENTCSFKYFCYIIFI